MSAPSEEPSKPTIVGRSSSHFTRVVRIFAAELGVECSFQIVRDILSTDPVAYGGNPALKMPSLITPRGTWFGALNVCRELSREAGERLRIVWPEDLDQPVAANAQELVLHSMATGVALIMNKVSGAGEGNEHHTKMRTSLTQSVSWLEANAVNAFAALPPDRDLSYLEVTLYCLVTHLDFRDVLSTEPYRELTDFCKRFGVRPSAGTTQYRFDV